MAFNLDDDELGHLLSIVVFVLVLCVVYLVILLPFSANAGVVVGAIASLTTLIGGLVGVRAARRNRDRNGRSQDRGRRG